MTLEMTARVALDEIRELEELAFNAWPALQTRLVGGWLLRFADGYTKRANSVNAWRPTLPVETVLEVARPVYAAHRMQLVVRVTPLAGDDTDAVLARCGFRLVDPSLVLVADLAQGLPQDLPADRRTRASILNAPERDWLELHARASNADPGTLQHHRRLLQAIAAPVAFGEIANAEGTASGWGIAVVERHAVGLFDIVTVQTERRKGLGQALVHDLLDWASGAGARRAYLQVEASNTPAIRLYRQLGFAEAYGYHYRIATD